MKHVDSTVDVSESKDGGTTITVPLIPSPTRLTRSAAASEAKVLRSKSISRSHFENHVALPIIDGKGKRGKNAAVTKDGDKVVPARMDSETDLATDGDDKANSPEKRGRGRLRNSSKKQTKVEVNGIASGEESGILGNGKVQSQYLIYPPAAPSSIFSPGLKTLSSRSKKAGEEDSEADLQERKVLEMFQMSRVWNVDLKK
ncbi:hypothetical protein D9758_005434 [Tetrapyrgos nigripes]|uniref:Uncharacterized protein n=1 Tax=Tetrapyrgos nigripes TaxID=182062 RepID=A0A8H5LPZ6_9AGAR|nr:hypothetical protein D9758_005434 [Tetrapyrgos nigripes]